MDDWDKQYKSSSQEMGQICDLERVQPQEIPFKVCVMFSNAFSVIYYYIISYIETVERKKKVFLQSLNLPKRMIVGFSMVGGLRVVLINMLYRKL